MKFNQHVCNLPTYEVGKPLEDVVHGDSVSYNQVIKLGSNENPFGVSPFAKHAIIENASLASVYPDDSYFELKEVLSKKYSVESGNVIVGSGSDQIIELCIHAVCNSESKILTSKTTFAMYEIYAQHVNANVIKTDDFLHNLDSMLKLYKKYKPDIIFLCTPNNPLGEALKKDDVIRFLNALDDDCLVVLDCAYMEYCAYKDDEYLISPIDVLQFSNVIYLGTFSKLYGLGGMRVGYGIANKYIIDTINKLRPPFNVTHISSKAAIAGLNDSDFIALSLKNNFDEMERYNKFALDKSLKILESYANFVTFLLHNQLNSTKIVNYLLQQGIIVRDLKSYGLNAIRITIGIASQNEIVIKHMSDAIDNI